MFLPAAHRCFKAALAALCILAPASYAQADELPTIRVAFNAPGDEAKLLMRAQPALFPAIGKEYNIQWIQLQGTATVSQALIAGTADCGITAPLTMAQAIVRAGLKPVLIGATIGESPSSFTSYWATTEDSPVRSVADLKGRKISVNTIGSQVDVMTRVWLKQHGLEPDRDVTIAEVPFPLSEAALRQKRIDAILLVQPFAAKAEQTGGLRKLGALRDVQPVLINLLEACRADFVDREPKAVAQYAKDFAAASQRFTQDHEASIALLADTLKIPRPAIESFMFTPRDYQRYPDGAIPLDAVQRSFDLFFEHGFLKDKLQVSQYVRPGITLATP